MAAATVDKVTSRRPGPLRWVWYAFGGGLPARYREWVLYDATCPSWAWRHFARAFAQMSLAAVPIMLIVPGPLWIRLVGILLSWLVAAQYALYNMHISVEHRVHKAGYPRGAAQAGRDEAHAEARAAAAIRYAARYRLDTTP